MTLTVPVKSEQQSPCTPCSLKCALSSANEICAWFTVRRQRGLLAIRFDLGESSAANAAAAAAVVNNPFLAVMFVLHIHSLISNGRSMAALHWQRAERERERDGRRNEKSLQEVSGLGSFDQRVWHEICTLNCHVPQMLAIDWSSWCWLLLLFAAALCFHCLSGHCLAGWESRNQQQRVMFAFFLPPLSLFLRESTITKRHTTLILIHLLLFLMRKFIVHCVGEVGSHFSPSLFWCPLCCCPTIRSAAFFAQWTASILSHRAVSMFSFNYICG